MSNQDYSRFRNIAKVLLYFIALIIGSLAIIAGGYDDSPGLQGLGLILLIFIAIKILRLIIRRRASQNPLD